MLTEKDYCDYDTCVALWSMGLIPHPYDNTDTDKLMAIISLYEAQKWLREEKNIHIEVLYRLATWTCKIYNLKNKEYIKGHTFFVSYEEALSEGIKEVVRILKEK